jgi:DNA primase
MPGIRFAGVRATVTMAEVLGLVGFVPRETSGDRVCGPCPVHHSTSPSGRSFSVNLRLCIYMCFKCGSCGNHPDPYAAATGRGLFEAAVELCQQLGRDIPRMLGGTSRSSVDLRHLVKKMIGSARQGCSIFWDDVPWRFVQDHGV